RSQKKKLWCGLMLMDVPLLMVALLVGFASGYGVRELKSRQRHRRWREKYWYGRPPSIASVALERSMSVPASHRGLSTSIANRNKPARQHIPDRVAAPGGCWTRSEAAGSPPCEFRDQG